MFYIRRITCHSSFSLHHAHPNTQSNTLLMLMLMYLLYYIFLFDALLRYITTAVVPMYGHSVWAGLFINYNCRNNAELMQDKHDHLHIFTWISWKRLFVSIVWTHIECTILCVCVWVCAYSWFNTREMVQTEIIKREPAHTIAAGLIVSFQWVGQRRFIEKHWIRKMLPTQRIHGSISNGHFSFYSERFNCVQNHKIITYYYCIGSFFKWNAYD